MKVAGGPTDLFRRYGRGHRGARVVDHAPDSRWHTTPLLAALRVTGLTAPAVFDGPIEGVSVLAYIEHVLAPTLRSGDVVVLDNLSVHRSPAGPRAWMALLRSVGYLCAGVKAGSMAWRADLTLRVPQHGA